ncbi:MAG TPA: hypothetical protein ENJ84_15620 [Gammaproteobacteria bacterium]|nr:hypothetical protein [Gammaproteobacteria bacterium]
MTISSNFKPFLDELARSANTVEAAVADNCRFEERASAQRWEQFEICLPHDDVGTMTWKDWAEANELHIDKRTNVPRTSIPDAFLTINRSAWKEAMAANQDIVRFENLTRPLKGMWDDSSTLEEKLDNLRELINRTDSGNDYDAEQTVAAFFEMWNNRRDNRPTFAAFDDEVRTECDDDDWPHALRDRLGLGHYGGYPGVLIPVALMRYSLQEVFETQKKRRLPVACALPTVLDGGMHEYFFPVPASYPFGATLHLGPSHAEVLTAEILHYRIEYERSHLFKLGFISKPHRQHDDVLKDSRDLHLTALRIETGKYDFGEELQGRT